MARVRATLLVMVLVAAVALLAAAVVVPVRAPAVLADRWVLQAAAPRPAAAASKSTCVAARLPRIC